jgi:hypothetical protein
MVATEITAQEPKTQEAVKPQPTEKPAAKKTAVRKASAKKSRATKSAPKKSAAKKKVNKKRAAKNPVAAKKSVSKKSAPKKQQTKKQPASTATSKAQSIRDTAKELGKKVRPRDIIAALAEKGITVTSPQVSTVLKAAGMRRGRRGRKSKAMASRNGKEHVLNSYDLLQVKKLATMLGGTDKLKEAVAALEQLR